MKTRFVLPVLTLVLSFGVSYALAWTGPTASPPNNNTPAPINVGATTQTKSGDICTSTGGKCLSNQPVATTQLYRLAAGCSMTTVGPVPYSSSPDYFIVTTSPTCETVRIFPEGESSEGSGTSYRALNCSGNNYSDGSICANTPVGRLVQ